MTYDADQAAVFLRRGWAITWEARSGLAGVDCSRGFHPLTGEWKDDDDQAAADRRHAMAFRDEGVFADPIYYGNDTPDGSVERSIRQRDDMRLLDVTGLIRQAQSRAAFQAGYVAGWHRRREDPATLFLPADGSADAALTLTARETAAGLRDAFWTGYGRGGYDLAAAWTGAGAFCEHDDDFGPCRDCRPPIGPVPDSDVAWMNAQILAKTAVAS